MLLIVRDEIDNLNLIFMHSYNLFLIIRKNLIEKQAQLNLYV